MKRPPGHVPLVGDVLCNVTREELVTAMHDALAVLPRIQWPFVVGEWIRV